MAATATEDTARIVIEMMTMMIEEDTATADLLPGVTGYSEAARGRLAGRSAVAARVVIGGTTNKTLAAAAMTAGATARLSWLLMLGRLMKPRYNSSLMAR